MILIIAAYKPPVETEEGNNFESMRTIRSPNIMASLEKPDFNIDKDNLSKANYFRTFARTCYN